jgi:REP element-mobilizing transposase RayT
VATEDPFALFITWTTYGTWLPGDERGYVSNTLLPGGGFLAKENRPGIEARKDDAFTLEQAKLQQNWDSVWLTPDEAFTAVSALATAASKRHWRILRAAAMANHIHLVVTDCPDDGPAVRRILKGNAHAELSTARGKMLRWWTTGGSDHYLHDIAAIEASIQYVANQHGKLAEIVDGRVLKC